MILINLLPEQHKAKGRAPARQLAAVAAAVTVNSLLFTWWGWTAFGTAAEVASELAVLEDTHTGLEVQVAYHKDLEEESALYGSRERTLSEITEARLAWTQKIDQLVDLVNRGGDGEKYLVWFNDLNVTQKIDKRRDSYGSLKATGFSGSGNFAHVANFLEDLERDAFAEDFFRPAPPEGSASTKDPLLMPSEVWNFPLELDIQSPEARAKARKAKAKAEAAPPANVEEREEAQ
ncbi:MAG: hypothetical protein WD226_14995 [Planctomycetota bacterium]